MNIWKLLWPLARYRFGMYLLSGVLASTMFYLFPLVPGLIVRAYFDALTQSSAAGLNEWSLLAILVGVAMARAGTLLITQVVETSVNVAVQSLLRRNILAQVLTHPGAQALPSSPGEAISRLRDDA
ncbi:MAG TPA: hypothetical protein VFT99_11390, partial [Roseiflexaceae bacterium]|nr:hypothetical protein [Roseiflexaceae bacterium]